MLTTETRLYAKVLLNIPVEGPFDYEIPPGMRGELTPGKRVWVDFGTRRLIGYVVGISESSDVQKVRPILEIIDKEPILSDEMLKLTKEISEYYICSWGNAMDAAVPSSLKRGKTEVRARVKEDYSSIAPSTDLKPTKEQSGALKSIFKSIKNKLFNC